MTNANLRVTRTLVESDPLYNPVLIVGKLKNLTKIGYDDIKCKFGDKVSEEVSLRSVLCNLKLFCSLKILFVPIEFINLFWAMSRERSIELSEFDVNYLIIAISIY